MNPLSFEPWDRATLATLYQLGCHLDTLRDSAATLLAHRDYDKPVIEQLTQQYDTLRRDLIRAVPADIAADIERRTAAQAMPSYAGVYAAAAGAAAWVNIAVSAHPWLAGYQVRGAQVAGALDEVRKASPSPDARAATANRPPAVQVGAYL